MFKIIQDLIAMLVEFFNNKNKEEVEQKETEPMRDRDLSKALELIRKWEGFRGRSYRDPVGIWTIGYGTIRYPDGTPVRGDEFVTKEKANSYLKDHVLHSVVPYIDKYVQVPLNNNQYCALVSFTYNLGAGALKKSTLLKKLNRGDYNGAAREFDRWVYAGGRKLLGLVRRRDEEQALFVTPREGRVV